MKSDLSVNEGLVLTNFNHNEKGNPHDQYQHLRGFTNYKSGNTNQYILIASLIINITSGTDDEGYTNFKVINALTGSALSQNIEVFARVRVTGGTPICELQSSDTANIFGIISQNTGSLYQLDIYAKNLINYGQFYMYENCSFKTSNVVIQYPNNSSNWLASLPGGTTTPTNLINYLTVKSSIDWGGYRYNPDGTVYMWGNVVITPDSLNVNKSSVVNYPVTLKTGAFAYGCNAKVGNPNQVFSTIGTLGTTSLTVYLCRTDALTATTINWHVFGY